MSATGNGLGVRIASSVLLGGLFGACASASEPCTDDASCGAGSSCVLGVCRCLDDRGCAAGLECNTRGSCQAPPACARNADCEAGRRCNLATGSCVLAEGCIRSEDCPFGQLCESGRCATGCEDDADCPLGRVCEADLCMTGCRDASGCPIGASCIGGQCFEDVLPGLCTPCGGSEDCPGREDWCLENRSFERGRPETGAARQCAPGCLGAPDICPNGTECRPVVVRITPPCTTNASCGTGRECLIDEGDPVGRCTCRGDADCTAQLPPFCTQLGFCEAPVGRLCSDDTECESVSACGPHGSGGARVCWRDRDRACQTATDCACLDDRCVLSGRRCASGADCPVSCMNGGCVVGAGCTPADGVYCPDLRR